MIKEIIYTGVQDASTRVLDKTIVVISILDFNSKFPRPSFDGCKDKLELSFKDRCEEEYGSSDWPDYISEDFSFRVLRQKGERLFDLSDAKRILSFFDKHHNSTEDLQLLIHCRAGVSRSAAVAMFLGEQYKIPFIGGDRFRPNPRILRMLAKARS